ncbi:MAG: hypothetical protein GY750_05945 [Lentisphaerae bacterium]|nr:hypothetical protein [Lentisphaerota bacterium]MCP4100951.1 hypothetical protein [Lentisphaerota bacterium]
MQKKIIAGLLTLTIGLSCIAGGKVRIDIKGIKNKIPLTFGKCDKNIVLQRITEEAAADQQYTVCARSKTGTTKDWKKYSFSFTPQASGLISIYFRGPVVCDATGKQLKIWIAYDNIKVTGTKAKFGDFEYANKKDFFDGFKGCTANMVTDVEDAQSGKNYVVTWHSSPVLQTLNIIKGQTVTVTFYAKQSNGKVLQKTVGASNNIG